MKTSISLFLILILSGAFGFAYVTIINGTLGIAELSIHRIDRLITLKKIDPSFGKNISKLEVSNVKNEEPVLYKVLVSQMAPLNCPPLKLLMSFDKNGKSLAFEVIGGGTAGAETVWLGVDDLSLAENSLHYLLDNPKDSKVTPLYNEFGTLELSKVSLGGKPAALAHLINFDRTQKLNVYLKTDGSFISAESVR